MVLFGRDWSTRVTLRFGKVTSGEKCKGKETEWWRRGGDNHEAREERRVVCAKDDAAMNHLWGPQDTCQGTVLRWPNILTDKGLVLLEEYPVQCPVIHVEVWLMPLNQPLQQETHGLSTYTSDSQRPLAKNWHRLQKQPANHGKWPQLHYDVYQLHDKDSTLASVQDNNWCPRVCMHIHWWYHLPTQSDWKGCIAPQWTLHSWLPVRSWKDSANKTANINSIPSRQRWTFWRLEQYGHMLCVLLRNKS